MYKISILPNKLRLITAPMRGTKTAAVLVMVGTGSRYETRANNGISHFLEHAFFKGTKKRPNTLAISSELDSIGAEFSAFTAKEYTGYWVKVDSSKIGVAVDTVSDMLINSKFEQKEIDREKGVIIEELNMYLDNPMAHIEDIFEKLLYGDTPAGWDTIGTKKNILNFKRVDFIKYLKAQYTANNIFVCLSGNFKEKEAANLVNKFFNKKKFNDRGAHFKEKEKVIEAQTAPALKLHYKKTDQAHLFLGARAFGYGHKDKTTAKLISIILGGSMSSRLFISLRERSGLAYYVSANYEDYTDSGYLTARAGVPVGEVEKAIKIILTEYKKIKNKLVPESELKRVKEMLAGRMALQFESSDSLANWYGQQAVMLNTLARENGGKMGKIFSPGDYLKQIRKIIAADIRRVAQEIFRNEKLNLAIIGPYKNEKKFERILNI